MFLFIIFYLGEQQQIYFGKQLRSCNEDCLAWRTEGQEVGRSEGQGGSRFNVWHASVTKTESVFGNIGFGEGMLADCILFSSVFMIGGFFVSSWSNREKRSISDLSSDPQTGRKVMRYTD